MRTKLLKRVEGGAVALACDDGDIAPYSDQVSGTEVEIPGEQLHHRGWTVAALTSDPELHVCRYRQDTDPSLKSSVCQGARGWRQS